MSYGPEYDESNRERYEFDGAEAARESDGASADMDRPAGYAAAPPAEPRPAGNRLAPAPAAAARNAASKRRGTVPLALFVVAVLLLTGGMLLHLRSLGVRLRAVPEGGFRLFYGQDAEAALPGRAPASTPSPAPLTPADNPPDASTDRGSGPLDASGSTQLDIVPVTKSPPQESTVLTIGQIVKRNLDSVVGVLARYGDLGDMSSGSGIIMTEDGYILTNNHVVQDASSISIVLNSGESYEVVRVRADSRTDLAVLKIDAAGLTAAEFGDSDQVEVGDAAVVIGNPMGMELQSTVTNGIISAISRDIVVDDFRMTMLQTNCAINPGNSGGPLINEYGQVVGIISSKIMSDHFSTYMVEGLGFAIPISTVKPIVDELIVRGYVKGRPAIGISGETITKRQGRYMGWPEGVQVITINQDCDAALQGLRVDDIITHINKTSVLNISDINLIKNDLQVGDTITATVYRPSERRTIEISFKLMDSGEMGG
ncbi:MAG: trypsin-like peptidase domain-containing protein [Oscillospiraceae bacterium]|nr:trypsin-like peptidase domain-containing protein [Oscillospiraceae bacterium]